MSNGSIVVLVVIGTLAALAVWRNLRKGAPCSCGCSDEECCEGCCGHAKKDS
ncbi:MAG: hypothetical protein IKO72_06165 [Kiritimatiellae bacterium]|nr:hypothetical protein [Kiritimatiellia bacterium]